MAIDPLSNTTRVERRNLLAVSTIAITSKAFSVAVDTIPVAGLSIHFETGVFSFLLMISTVYFLVVFLLYYFVDLKDFPVPNHLKETDKIYSEKVAAYRQREIRRLNPLIEALMPPGYRAVVDDRLVGNALTDADDLWPQRSKFDASVSTAHGETPIKLLYRGEGDKDSKWLKRSDNLELQQKAEEVLYKLLNTYGHRVHLYRMMLRPKLYAIHFLYMLRLYAIDGILPVCLAVLAVAALYNLIDVTWLSNLVPANIRKQ